MEKSPENFFKKAKDNIVQTGRKAAAGIVLLSTLTASELKAQQVLGVPKIEQQDSTLYNEAEQKYQKLVAHRDSILEYNAEVKKMNLKMEKMSNEIQRFLYEKNGGDFSPKLKKAVTIGVPKYITQKGVASSGPYFSRDHEISFQRYDAEGISKVKEETVAWKTLMDSYEFTWPAVDENNPAVKYTRDFFKQYVDTKTGNDLNRVPLKIQGANFKTVYCPIFLDPHKWSHPSHYKHGDELVDYTGDTLSNFELISYYGDYGDDHRYTFTVKKQLGRLDQKSSHSLAEIEHRLTYKGEKPKLLKLTCFESVRVDAHEPFGKDELSKGGITAGTDFSINADFICTPVWNGKPVPKLPKKDKFITTYIASHKTVDSTVMPKITLSEKKDSTTKTMEIHPSLKNQMIDSNTKQKESIVIPHMPENNTEQTDWYPIYGPNGGYIGNMSEFGRFVPLPINEREHLNARDTSFHSTDPNIRDPLFVHYDDMQILQKYDNGGVDQFIENLAEPKRIRHHIDTTGNK